MMKHLLFLLIPIFLFCTCSQSKVIPDSETEENVRLARQMSRLLGVTVKPADVAVFPVSRIQRWVGIPSFLVDKLKNQEYSRFIFVEFEFNENVREVILKVPEDLVEKYGGEFVIAVNQNSRDRGEPITSRCEARRCDESGNCRMQVFLIEGTNCADMCATNEQCEQPCFVGICEDGACRPSVIYSKDCASISGTCLSALECTVPGTDSSCERKMCMLDGHCWEVSYQIDSTQIDCPSDDCDKDEDCVDFDFGDDAGILDDIKEVYGY